MESLLSLWCMHWDHKPEQVSDLRFDISGNEEEKDEEEQTATKLDVSRRGCA